MANWTDNPQLLTQFNEYTPQQPIDAMVAVGQTTQQRYNEGVQRIQQQIDKVAGIDIVKDSDKKYLQSKLNQLNTDLKKVAAGDFSNYQLTNSVGGMITSISKDKNIQNAAYSTAWYKKQLAKMEKDSSEGKANPANIDYFNKKANQWLSSDKPGEKFNSEYIPYFDVFKHAKETFDAVKPDGYSFDQLYVTDQNGVPKTDAYGRPIASPTLIRLEKEGNLGKVQNVLNEIFSDPRVDTQLSITGEYNLQGISPEMLSSRILRQKDKLVDDLSKQKGLLEIQKNLGKNVQSEIDNVSLNIENLKSKYDDFSNLALTNPDIVRASLYKDEVRNNYTSMFGWSKVKEQSMENPLWNANFRLNQEANRVAEFRERMDFEKGKEQFDREYKLTDLALKQQTSKKEGEIINPDNFKQDFQESDTFRYISEFDQTYENAAINYNRASDDFIFSMKYGSSEEAAREVENLIKAGNSREKAINLYLEKELKDSKVDWEMDAMKEYNILSPEHKTKHSSKVDTYNNFVAAKRQFEDASVMKNRAEQRMIEMGHDPEKLKSLVKPVKINIDGEQQTITPEDIYDLVMYSKGNKSSIGFLNDSEIRRKAKESENRLISSGKEELLSKVLNATTPAFYDIPTVTYRALKSPDYLPKNLQDEIDKMSELIDDEQLSKSLAAKSDIIKELGFSVAPNLRANIMTGNVEKDRKLTQQILTTAANYNNNKQQLSDDFDYSDWESALSNKNVTVELKTRNINGKVIPTLVAYDGGKQLTSMVVSAEELQKDFGVDPSVIYEGRDIKGLRDRISDSPNKRTSVGNPNDISTYAYADAYFQKVTNDFPKLPSSGPDVMANLKVENGKVYPIIFVYDGEKAIVRELPGEVDIPDAVKRLKEKVSPEFINQILNED